MLFKKLVDVFEKVEATTKRLEMTDILVALLKETPHDIIDKVVYLSLGEIYPPFIGLELGLAEKLAVKALALATGVKEKLILEELKKTGGLGQTGENILSRRKARPSLFREELTVERVYSTLEKICKASGKGAQELKIRYLAGLLANAEPKEAKYLLRIAQGRLRLGIADMTVLDALAIAFCGSKEYRDVIERAYNLSSDIGLVARTVAEGGLEAVKRFRITIGRPIKPQLAERLSTIEEILEKMGGECYAEYKYDGLRIQAHVSPEKVYLFSRRQENLTEQFPDVVEAVREAVKAKEAILDGECVPVDPHTGELLPFQVVAHRRGRKYDVERMVEEVPVVYFVFDLLYVDGEDLTLKPYTERRERLSGVVTETSRVKLAEYIVSGDAAEIEKFFHKAVQEGAEGLLCKSPKSLYEAGKRGWAWIKWKRSYRSEMVDTVDLVVVGAFAGKGKRAGTYGALLMAAYNHEDDTFETVCKLGSGFTDEELARLPEMFKPYLRDTPHPRVKTVMKADFWFTPAVVLEVIGDEITLSPMHTCGMNAIRPGSGLAIRFPRLVRFRSDKGPEDATTVKEIIEMYNRQLKKVEQA